MDTYLWVPPASPDPSQPVMPSEGALAGGQNILSSKLAALLEQHTGSGAGGSSTRLSPLWGSNDRWGRGWGLGAWMVGALPWLSLAGAGAEHGCVQGPGLDLLSCAGLP